MIRVMKAFGSLRYVTAALFFVAVFYATYEREVGRAAYCMGGSTVVYTGPNSGNFATQEECEEHFTEGINDQGVDDCDEYCDGAEYVEGSAWAQCCTVTSGGFEFSSGMADCIPATR